MPRSNGPVSIAPGARLAFCFAIVGAAGSGLLRPHHGPLVRRDVPNEMQNQGGLAGGFVKDIFGVGSKSKHPAVPDAVRDDVFVQDGKDPTIVKSNPFAAMPEVEDAPGGADTPLDPPLASEEEALDEGAPMFLQMAEESASKPEERLPAEDRKEPAPAEDTLMELKKSLGVAGHQLHANATENQTRPTVSITVQAPEAEVHFKARAAAEAAAAAQGGGMPGPLVEDDEKYVGGRMPIGTQLCQGATVGVDLDKQECQFREFVKAKEFCDSEPKCTAILQRYGSGHCAGGYGCFSPRTGEPVNRKWGGKTWLKGGWR